MAHGEKRSANRSHGNSFSAGYRQVWWRWKCERCGTEFSILIFERITMKRIHRLAVVVGLAGLFTLVCLAQAPAGKKEYVFHGKVEKVNPQSLTVNGEKVAGWMDAMTMDYK